MVYDVIPTDQFEKDIKFYKRKRHYNNIQDDINGIIEELEKGNLIGDEIPELKLTDREHTYKVRAMNTDTNVGKSNGYRLIYYVIKDDATIFLLTIYYKKEKEDISIQEILSLISENC